MIQVGFGVADITPKVGMGKPGGFYPSKGQGVLDPLIASACVVFDGTTAAALVGIDAIAVMKETVAAARDRIAQTTKIPASHIMVGASHTHCGGPAADLPGDAAEPEYVQMVEDGIVAAVTSAWNTLHAAQIGVGTGRQEGIAFNRRFLMNDGREITHPGKPGTEHHDAIVRPAGPVDESVGVLAARAPDGQVLGLVVHFSCHSTVVGGTKFSADYAGYLRAHLRSRLGPDLPVVFLLGACGDVTQVDNRAPGRDFGPDHADMMGRLLAGETLRTLNRMTWLDDAPVRVAVETARCAIRPEPDPKAEAPAFGLGSGWDEVFERERKAVAEQRAKTPVLDCEVQAVRVGPLGVVSNGSEFFADLGLRLKDASPLPTTWVATLTNEYLGYVCTPQAFVSGGYEPRTARSSKLAIDAGQRLIEAGVKALAATTS